MADKKSNKVIKVVGIIVLIFIGLAIIGGASNTNKEVDKSLKAPAANTPAPEPEKPKFDVSTFYSKVTN